MQLVESVPNISEGRDEKLINSIVREVASYKNLWLVSKLSDPSYNRSFFTIVGSPDSLEECLYNISRIAVEKIDMNLHRGAHPRIGAIDVIPIVPIMNIEEKQAQEVVTSLSSRISRDLALPVFLYEKPARKDCFKNINNIRKGEFEGLAKKMKEQTFEPDFGPRTPHKTAGATIIGLREPLLSINFSFSISDRWLIDQIRREVLIELPSSVFVSRDNYSKRFSLSLNISAKEYSMIEVYDKVREIAEHFNCSITDVELASPITSSMALGALAKLTGGLKSNCHTIEQFIISSL